MYDCSDLVAFQDAGKVARGFHIEDEDGHVAVAAEGEGGAVHHFEVLRKGFVEGELVVFDGRGVLLGIGGVDPVDAGALEEGVGADLEGAERGAAVGGEERVAGAAGDDDDGALFEFGDGVVTHIVMGEGLHRNGGEYLGGNTFGFDEAGEGQGVDHRGEHSHLVAVHAVETFFGSLHAAENVAAAVDDADLEAGTGSVRDFFGQAAEGFRVEADAAAASEAFAAEFE
jgi:hypothetical protein